METSKSKETTYSPRVLKALGIWAPIPLAVLHDEKLPPNAKLLYGLLQQMNFNAKQRDIVWPSQFLLRGYLGLGRTQIVKLLKCLEDRKLIRIEKRRHHAGTQNVYYLLPLSEAYGQWASTFRISDWIDLAFVKVTEDLSESERAEAAHLIEKYGLRIFRVEESKRAANFQTSTNAADEVPLS